MSEYRCVINLNADADEVFGYVSDPGNIPEYLPSVQTAEMLGGSRVMVRGISSVGAFEAGGTIRVDENSRRIEWRSEGENRYQGWLQVAGDGRSCQLTARLMIEPNTVLDAQSGDRDSTIDVALRTALKAIKSVCEGSPVPAGGVAYADNPPG